MHVDTISSLAIGCWLALVLGGEELNRLLQLICCVVSPHALTDLFIHPFIYLFCRRYSLERVLALTKSKTRNTKQAREHKASTKTRTLCYGFCESYVSGHSHSEGL